VSKCGFRSGDPIEANGCLLHHRVTVHSNQCSSRRLANSTGFIARNTSRWVATCAGAASLLGLWGCAHEHLYTVEDYRRQYSKPLLSSGAQFAALPPAVQNTIRAEAGSASIEEVIKETNLTRVTYQVHFQNSNWFEPMLIAADGSLLDPDLIVAIGAPKEDAMASTGSASSGTSLNDLPPAAVKAVQRHAPDAQVDSVIRQVSGNQVIYIVTFKDRAHAPLQVTADGSITPEPAK
jgi:hypothetical protein